MFDLFAIVYDNGYHGFAYAKYMSGVQVGDEVITEFDLGTKGRVVAVVKYMGEDDDVIKLIKAVHTIDRILKRIIEVEA